MPAETLNQLGFVKIPEAVQRHMGLRPGDKIDIRILEDGRVMMVKAGVVWSTQPARVKPKKAAPMLSVYPTRGDYSPYHVTKDDSQIPFGKSDFDFNDEANDPNNQKRH